MMAAAFRRNDRRRRDREAIATGAGAGMSENARHRRNWRRREELGAAIEAAMQV